MPSLKGITSERIASPCLLKLYNEGQLQMLNKSEPQQFSQFTAHFNSYNTNQQTQSCNYVTFVPMGEDTPLQVPPYSISLRGVWHCVLLNDTVPNAP